MQGRNAQRGDYALPNGRASALAANSLTDTQTLIASCAAAADELIASRKLIDALDAENAALKARLETEKQTTALLSELNETRRTENEALRSALTAKNDAIAAKDAVIASQDKLIETLKRKKSSPWKRVGDVLIGVGVGVLVH
jgi:hypothetical protein